jgi:glycosyltransferase involved in cell wall biosynthesis
MNDTKPLVSVLMTAYNRSKYIAEAIESVLASTYKNFELIVVDDCSTDNTEFVVKTYAEKDTRVKYYKNKENLGDYPNRNKAASYAKGKYIKYLDSDDILYPHGLEVMINCMEQYPEAGFGLSENAFEDKPQPAYLDPHQSYTQNFLHRDLFGRAPGSSIIRTTAFSDVGGFTGKRQVGDHEFWFIIARKYSLVTMPRDLVWDRMHGEQEKMYDDESDKAGMHFQIQKEALFHPDCPLSVQERNLAVSKLVKKQSNSFWRITLRGAGIREALRYKGKTELSWLNLLLVFW